jgi:hypothetical protein
MILISFIIFAFVRHHLIIFHTSSPSSTQISASLIPLLFVTIVIVMAFSHMFHAAGPLEGASSCHDYDSEDLWTCSLSDSYFQSVAMLLSGDWVFFDSNKGLHSGLAMIFAFVIGILLLNIIIALISNVYTGIESNSQKAIWASRVRFVNELWSMRSVFSLNLCTFQEGWSSSHYLPERRILSQWDRRGYDDWEPHKKEDDDFEDNNLVKRNGRADFIGWYIYETESSTYDDFGLCWRLRGFMHIAEWKEIFPPSLALQKVLLGKMQDEEIEGFREKFIAWLGSCIFFILTIVAAPVVLVLGFVTCGYLWPKELKEFLFFGPVEIKESDQKQAHAAEVDRLEKKVDGLKAEVSGFGEKLDKVLLELQLSKK